MVSVCIAPCDALEYWSHQLFLAGAPRCLSLFNGYSGFRLFLLGDGGRLWHDRYWSFTERQKNGDQDLLGAVLFLRNELRSDHGTVPIFERKPIESLGKSATSSIIIPIHHHIFSKLEIVEFL